MTHDPAIRLRPAGPDDAATVAEIWRAGWREAHIGRVPAELVAARTDESFRTRATESVTKTTVAMVGAELAGFVMVAADEVEQLYVPARHRGAGVADTLLRHGEGTIKAAGHATAWLAVVPGNARARRFYERMGWTDGGPFEHLAPGDDGPIAVPAHRYVKRLSEAIR
jgi:ribosomal protein S18 acetylase RimI-like enzyme